MKLLCGPCDGFVSVEERGTCRAVNCPWPEDKSQPLNDKISQAIADGLNELGYGVDVPNEAGQMKFGPECHEVQTIKGKILEAVTEDKIREVVLDWKYFWMNQTQNSKADYDNYRGRAWGIDANMQYSLAKQIRNFLMKGS